MTTPNDPVPRPPPPEPPPTLPIDCPPGCLIDSLFCPALPTTVAVDLRAELGLDLPVADAPTQTDSVTHVVCSTRVFGLRGDSHSTVTVLPHPSAPGRMVDGGSNVCVTRDLCSLLDVVNIDPITISVAIEGAPTSYDDCITKRGLLPMTLTDGTIYYQPCYYCANMVETIISPAAVLASSDVFYSWTQDGFKDPTVPGRIRFSSHDGLASMSFPLHCREGLYYCDTDVITVDHNPVRSHCQRTALPPPLPVSRPPSKFKPTTRTRKLESKVWLLRFGSPGEDQLDVLPRHVDGTPLLFEYHPFRSIDFKEQAYIRRQPAHKKAEQIPGCASEFFMDFGFLRASTEDYKRPNKIKDRIVHSYDGYCAYLLIVDSESRRT
jgi:hypothetical protein